MFSWKGGRRFSRCHRNLMGWRDYWLVGYSRYGTFIPSSSEPVICRGWEQREHRALPVYQGGTSGIWCCQWLPPLIIPPVQPRQGIAKQNLPPATLGPTGRCSVAHMLPICLSVHYSFKHGCLRRTGAWSTCLPPRDRGKGNLWQSAGGVLHGLPEITVCS